jgi:hypothetical protein
VSRIIGAVEQEVTPIKANNTLAASSRITCLLCRLQWNGGDRLTADNSSYLHCTLCVAANRGTGNVQWHGVFLSIADGME